MAEHDSGEMQCRTCVHACALSVERSFTYVRCGNPSSVNCGKWTRAWNYSPKRCRDYVRVVKGDSAYDDAFEASCRILSKVASPRGRKRGDPRPQGPAVPEGVDPETYRAYVPIVRTAE